MNLKLEDKTALVTGSTAGIGLAIALGLVREGARGIVNGRTQARIDAALASIRQQVPQAKVEGVALDLGTAAGCEALVRRVPTVDILINNLGIFEPKPFEQIPDADWQRFFEVNVMSGVRLSRAFSRKPNGNRVWKAKWFCRYSPRRANRICTVSSSVAPPGMTGKYTGDCSTGGASCSTPTTWMENDGIQNFT